MARRVYSPDMPKMRVVLLVGLGFLAGVFGWAVGALPLSGAEPDGLFVNCGPALFGRPSPLPDPSCGAAYALLPWVSIGLIVLAVTLFAVAVRQWRRSARPSGVR